MVVCKETCSFGAKIEGMEVMGRVERFEVRCLTLGRIMCV